MSAAEQTHATFATAAEEGRVTRFYWREYPAGKVDCIPLHIGESAITVCEIDDHFTFNRIIAVRPEDIESVLPIHGYREFLRWALHRNGQNLPDWFPMGATLHEILEQLVQRRTPVRLYARDGTQFIGRLLRCDDTDVELQEIDFAGYYCPPNTHKTETIIRVDSGGVYETCLFEHAETQGA